MKSSGGAQCSHNVLRLIINKCARRNPFRVKLGSASEGPGIFISRMRVNVKRGFNRLYIVLAVLWACYCLVIYPRQQIREANKQYGEEVGICYQYSPQEGRADCMKRAEQMFKTNVAQWSFKNFYLWAWWLLILAVVVFPLALYGFFRGAAAVGLWVWRGFRATSP